MMSPRRAIDWYGGIATRAEIMALGPWRSMIDLELAYGAIIRVRRGWYASPWVSADVIAARQVGGPLACVSALAHYGMGDPPGELHVLVSRQASRLPTEVGGRSVVLHWTRLDPPGDRHAVTPSTALEQADRCSAVLRVP